MCCQAAEAPVGPQRRQEWKTLQRQPVWVTELVPSHPFISNYFPSLEWRTTGSVCHFGSWILLKNDKKNKSSHSHWKIHTSHWEKKNQLYRGGIINIQNCTLFHVYNWVSLEIRTHLRNHHHKQGRQIHHLPKSPCVPWSFGGGR